MHAAASPGMANPRPRGRGAALARIAAAAATAALLASAEARRPDSKIPGIDNYFFEVMQKFLPPGRTGPLVLESSPDADTRVFAPAPDPSLLPVPLCRYERADQSILVEWPPGPVDLAMAIESFAGARALALAWVPEWEAPDEGTLATRAFANARARFPGLPFLHAYGPAYTAAPAENAMDVLARVPALDRARVHGDVWKIPEVNDPGPWPPEAGGLAPGDAGYTRLLLLAPLEAPPGRIALPLLVRAGDRIHPSLALLAYLRARGLDAGAVDARLGGALLAGESAIPVDERGCLLLPLGFAARVPVFSPLAEDAALRAAGKTVVIGHEGMPTQAGADGDVAIWTAAALGAMEAGDFARPIRVLHRAPRGVVEGWMVVMAVAAGISLWVPKWRRLWVAVVPALALAVAARHAAIAHGQFFSLVLPLGVGILCFALALRFPSPVPRAPGSATAGDGPERERESVPQEESGETGGVVSPARLAGPPKQGRPAEAKKKPKVAKRRRKG